MKRLKDGFLSKLHELIPLEGARLLEIGCGNGSRSVGFAGHSKELFAIDPDVYLIQMAKERNIVNAIFRLNGQKLVGFHPNLVFPKKTQC